MYVHHARRLIYLAHPRTASNATAAALQRVGFRKQDPPADHHSRLFDDASPVLVGERHRWLAFTAVRNHYDAAVSWVARRRRVSKLRGVDEFRLALERGNRWVQKDRLWWLHADDVDVILRYETLQQDLDRLLSSEGIPPVEIPRLNESEAREGRHYSEFYDDETRAYVEQKFRTEIRRFGYHYETQ